MVCHPERVPEDILPPIFEHFTDRRDLYACSLVSWTFNRAVTPVLYRSWDAKVIADLPAGATRLKVIRDLLLGSARRLVIYW
jgi:F-box-like